MFSVNNTVNWDEIKEMYPDCWAFVDPNKIKRKDGFIEKCYVYIICPIEEKGMYVVEFRKKGIDFDCIRTTFSAPNVGVFA